MSLFLPNPEISDAHPPEIFYCGRVAETAAELLGE